MMKTALSRADRDVSHVITWMEYHVVHHVVPLDLVEVRCLWDY